MVTGLPVSTSSGPGEPETPETGLQQLVDGAAIADVVARLAFAQDDRDWDAFGALFTDEVHFDLSRHLGRPPADLARTALVEAGRQALDGFDGVQHAITNVLTTVSGDEARCRASVTAYHYLATEPGVADHCIMRGTWDLRLRRLDGRWLIHTVVVTRTVPFEGFAGVYDLAAARAENGPASVASILIHPDGRAGLS